MQRNAKNQLGAPPLPTPQLKAGRDRPHQEETHSKPRQPVAGRGSKALALVTDDELQLVLPLAKEHLERSLPGLFGIGMQNDVVAGFRDDGPQVVDGAAIRAELSGVPADRLADERDLVRLR